jgi:hypothetical protein
LDVRFERTARTSSADPVSSTPIALLPAAVMIRLIGRPSALSRQTGIPGFAFTSRISFLATRLEPTFDAAALFIIAGTTAIPSSRAAAADKTMS